MEADRWRGFLANQQGGGENRETASEKWLFLSKDLKKKKKDNEWDEA